MTPTPPGVLMAVEVADVRGNSGAGALGMVLFVVVIGAALVSALRKRKGANDDH